MPAYPLAAGGKDAIMSKYLHMLVAWMARAHDAIMTLNDSFETNFSDKELHFLVIGAIGLGLIMLIYPVFKLLANRNRVLAITWIYVVTVLTVLAFAIEIGQRITGTGDMDFGDIVAGMGGFFAVTAVLVALRVVISLLRLLFRRPARRPERLRGQRSAA